MHVRLLHNSCSATFRTLSRLVKTLQQNSVQAPVLHSFSEACDIDPNFPSIHSAVSPLPLMPYTEFIMEEDGDRWVCSACTFSNDANCDACAMCYTRKPAFSWSLHRYRRSLSICSVSRCLTNILSGVLTCVFALVGSLLGAITGALAGRAAQSGLFRGAGLGAVAGAVLSVEVLEASRAYWHSERSESSSSPSMSDFLEDVLSGRFRQDFLGPTLSAAQRWQINLADMSYEELYDMLLPAEGRIKGASQEFLGSLPRHTVTQGNRVDVYGDVICCTICLQDLQEGEIARALPACKHTFHMKCVDQWLSRCLLCPVCRQYI